MSAFQGGWQAFGVLEPSNQADNLSASSHGNRRGFGAQNLQRPGHRCPLAGPITADTARSLGLRVDIQAADYTIPGLVEAIKGRFATSAHGTL
jgi:hypothetical protein